MFIIGQTVLYTSPIFHLKNDAIVLEIASDKSVKIEVIPWEGGKYRTTQWVKPAQLSAQPVNA